MTESDFERFFTLSSELLCILEGNGHFHQVSPVLSGHLGFTEQELLGRPLVETVYPDDRDDVSVHLSSLLKGTGIEFFRCRHRCQNGSVCWIEWKASADGEAVYAVGRDVTESVDQLERKDRLEVLGQLAGSVAHEMRNPLGAIANSVYHLR